MKGAVMNLTKKVSLDVRVEMSHFQGLASLYSPPLLFIPVTLKLCVKHSAIAMSL